MRTEIRLTSDVHRSARVMQMEGMFDVAPSKQSVVTLDVDLPIEAEPWQVGLIVGPSGSGKTSVAKALWPAEFDVYYDWRDRALLDDFPKGMPIGEIIELINSVGFSSPPSWVRPFHVLSTGEQFRVGVARALAEAIAADRSARGPGGAQASGDSAEPKLVVLDEFTSVVDRTVARVGSSAIGRTIRQHPELRLVAVTCHDDVEEWLQPDWVYSPASGVFTRRLVQRRPPIDLVVRRVHHSAWNLFRQHHYLDTNLNHAANCFVAFWGERPVCFSSWLSQPHGQIHNLRREHRTVVLPDFQGVGIGNAVSAHLASMWRALGFRAMSTTSHPSMVRSRAKSTLWRMHRTPARTSGGGMMTRDKAMGRSIAIARLTAGFEYVGPPMERARAKELLGG